MPQILNVQLSTAHAYSKFINLRLPILDILRIRLKYAFIMENLKGKKNRKHKKSSGRLPVCSMPFLHSQNSTFKVDACLHICLFSECFSTFPEETIFVKEGICYVDFIVKDNN